MGEDFGAGVDQTSLSAAQIAPGQPDAPDQDTVVKPSWVRPSLLIALVIVLALVLLGSASWYALSYATSRPSSLENPQLAGTWTFTDVRSLGSGGAHVVPDHAILVITPDGTYRLDATAILKGTAGTKGNVRVAQGDKLQFYAASFPFGLPTRLAASNLAFKIDGDVLSIDDGVQTDIFQRVPDVLSPAGAAQTVQQSLAGSQTAANAPGSSVKDASRILGTWNAPPPANPGQSWDVSYTFKRDGTFVYVMGSPDNRQGTPQDGAKYAITLAGDQPVIHLDFGNGFYKTLSYGFQGDNALVLDGTTFTRGRQ